MGKPLNFCASFLKLIQILRIGLFTEPLQQQQQQEFATTFPLDAFGACCAPDKLHTRAGCRVFKNKKLRVLSE
jgi:hypothetical protein